MEEFGIRWIAVGAGVLSFLVAYSFDWAALKKTPGLKQTIAVTVFVLQGYALYAASWNVARFAMPLPVSLVGLVLLLFSLLLWVYSFFVEIPFAKTYAKRGSGDQLVTTGTYALVRHPGVLWYAMFMLALFFATGSMTLVVAAPIWTLMNILYVVIQERFFFDKMFPGYREYRRQTPMLIPTRQSIGRCLRTLKPKKEVVR